MKFLKKKNNDNKKCCCSCDKEIIEKALEGHNEGSRIKILGSGCEKCLTLENNVKEVLDELNINISVGHITDFVTIASYGVMSTPALVIDENVVSFGKVLNKEEIIKHLEKVGLTNEA